MDTLGPVRSAERFFQSGRQVPGGFLQEVYQVWRNESWVPIDVRQSAARTRPGLRSIDWALLCQFAFAVGLASVSRFSISRISRNPSRSLQIQALGAVCTSFSLGSFLLERSAGA